jgi:hypothetical protein
MIDKLDLFNTVKKSEAKTKLKKVHKKQNILEDRFKSKGTKMNSCFQRFQRFRNL